MSDVAVTQRYLGTLAEAPPWFSTRDGTCLRARAIRPDDAARLIDLFERLSSESRRPRFHFNPDNLSEELKWETACALADVDNFTLGGAVVAVEVDAAGQERIVGVARLARPKGEPTSPEAEAAVVIRDDYHGRGVGTELLRRMVLLAKQMRLHTIVAIIEADNEPALRVFRGLALPAEVRTQRAETEMRFEVPG
jgi:RimJ/RimL family protein N-acetyltransferase